MAEQQTKLLDHAFALIEQDELQEARSILQTMIDSQPNDPDVWWLYAHAVQDVDNAQTALRNVARINPKYPGLEDLQQELSQITGVLPQAAVAPEQLSDLDVFDDDDELDALFDDELPQSRDIDDEHLPDMEEFDDSSSGRLRRILVVVSVVSVLALVGILILLSGGGESETPPSAATDIPDSMVEEVTLSVFDATSANVLIDLLSNEFSLADMSSQTVLTELGQTEVVSICTDVGEGLRSDLEQAFEIIALSVEMLPQDKDAFAVQMVDCNRNEIINVIGVTKTSLEGFANATLTPDQFQGSWVAVTLESMN